MMLQVALSAGGGAEALLLDMVFLAVDQLSQISYTVPQVELQTLPLAKNQHSMK